MLRMAFKSIRTENSKNKRILSTRHGSKVFKSYVGI